jgi:hypothetical protein
LVELGIAMLHFRGYDSEHEKVTGRRQMSTTAFGLALGLHVAAGSAGLVLGPIAMFSAKRPGLHTRSGSAYYYVFIILFGSSVALAALDLEGAWWLALVGGGSYALALVGYRAAKRRQPGWLVSHVSGMAGSYISMVTALLVVNVNAISGVSSFSRVLAWMAPTVIGTPIITWINFQIAAGRRPKAWRRQIPTVA